MKMPGGPPVINARTKINRGFRFRGVCARETRRPTYFTRPFFLVTTGTNDGRYINQGNANSSHPLSALVHLGSDFKSSILLQIRPKERGMKRFTIRIIRFSASCSPRHVSTTWKKIDRPINRNRAAPPLFYRIIERMSQRSLTRPSPSDLPYSRFRSEIIRNRKRERERGRQRDEDEDEAWAKSHRSHHATE